MNARTCIQFVACLFLALFSASPGGVNAEERAKEETGIWKLKDTKIISEEEHTWGFNVGKMTGQGNGAVSSCRMTHDDSLFVSFTHSWSPLPDTLIPGRTYSFQCSAKVSNVKKWHDGYIRASSMVPATEGSGSATAGGKWTWFSGAAEGEYPYKPGDDWKKADSASCTYTAPQGDEIGEEIWLSCGASLYVGNWGIGTYMVQNIYEFVMGDAKAQTASPETETLAESIDLDLTLDPFEQPAEAGKKYKVVGKAVYVMPEPGPINVVIGGDDQDLFKKTFPVEKGTGEVTFSTDLVFPEVDKVTAVAFSPHEQSYVDIDIKAPVLAVRVDVEKDKIIANGRDQTILTLTAAKADGSAAANRRLIVSIPDRSSLLPPGKVNGYWAANVDTDKDGRAQVTYTAPRAGQLQCPRDRFPVSQEIVIEDAETGSKRQAAIELHCPYPRITRAAIPSVQAGDWERTHAAVDVEDGDSDSLTYTLRGPFTFHPVKGSFAEKVCTTTAGKELMFRCKTDLIGRDMQKHPDLAKKLWDANLSLLINEVGFGSFGMSEQLKKSDAAKPTGVGKVAGCLKAVNGLMSFAGEAKGDAEAIGTEMAREEGERDRGYIALHALNTSIGAAEVLTETAKDFSSPGKSGLTDGLESFEKKFLTLRTPSWMSRNPTMGRLDKMLTSETGRNVTMLGLKATYANLKVFYEGFQEYKRIAFAGSGSLVLPLLIEVRDGDGYVDKTVRNVVVIYRK